MLQHTLYIACPFSPPPSSPPFCPHSPPLCHHSPLSLSSPSPHTSPSISFFLAPLLSPSSYLPFCLPLSPHSLPFNLPSPIPPSTLFPFPPPLFLASSPPLSSLISPPPLSSFPFPPSHLPPSSLPSPLFWLQLVIPVLSAHF